MISLFVPVITPPAPLLTANKRLCVCHGIRVTLRCLPLPVSFSHPTPLLTTTTFSCVLLLSPPSSPWCFARCVRTAGWRWMMPFATSSWTSPVFHPGWLGRATSSRQSSTRLSPPKRSITRAKVLCKHKQDTDIKSLSYCFNVNIVFLYFPRRFAHHCLGNEWKVCHKMTEINERESPQFSCYSYSWVFVQNFFPTKIAWDYLDTSTLFCFTTIKAISEIVMKIPNCYDAGFCKVFSCISVNVQVDFPILLFRSCSSV